MKRILSVMTAAMILCTLVFAADTGKMPVKKTKKTTVYQNVSTPRADDGSMIFDGSKLGKVYFHHGLHVSKLKNCASCHHVRERQCTSCHTKTSKITRRQAFHGSCMKCHQQRKLKSASCLVCHRRS